MSSIENAGSVIVAAVETAWASIQKRHPEVPGVVVTFGAGTIGTAPGTVRLGHFAPSRWTNGTGAEEASTDAHELFIGGEGLARGATNLLGTLLHEAAHGLAHARGIKDTSRQGRYHNRRFKDTAEELGIAVAQTGAIGWSDTSVPDDTAADYAAELVELGLAVRAVRRAEGTLLTIGGTEAGEGDGEAGEDSQKDAKKRRNGVAAICRCDMPRRIRVALSVWEAGPITCGVCDAEFTDPDDTADEHGEDD